MFQRKIMFKQQNQQHQDLGDSRNQEYINQLASLKQASAVQYGSTFNGEPLRDLQMHALGNMHMMQQGGGNVLQGFPNGVIGFSGQNNGPSSSTPQFDVPGYGSIASNSDKNINPYYQFQGLSSQSDNMLSKNNYKILGTSGMHLSGFASSFGSQQEHFASDQITDGALLPNQMFHENNLFGQVPVESLNNDILSANYANQRIRMQSHEDTSWNEVSALKSSQVTMPEADASLDPLERKILYGTDDTSLGLLFGGSQFVKGDFQSKMENVSYRDKFPPAQSGSWSALMQTAVADEDWSGLNFHNQDQSPDNTPLSVMKNEKHQNIWVDRNLHNVSSPSPELHKSDLNSGFPSLQLSGHHYPKHEEEFQQKHATGGTQLFQTFPSSNGLPFQCDEGRGNFCNQGSTSISTSSGLQNTFDQVNHVNLNRFSAESHKLVSRANDERMSTNFLASSAPHELNMNAQRRMVELLNRDEISNDVMRMNSRASYSSMGNSASIQSPYVNDYNKNPSPQNHMAANIPGHSGASSQVIYDPSGVSADSKNAHTLTGPSTSTPHVSAQQDLSSPKSHKFYSNLFRSTDSSSSHLETNSASPNEQPSEKEIYLNSFKMHNLIPPTSSVSQHLSHQADKKDTEALAFPDGSRALGQPSNQNNPIFHQMLSPRNTGFDLGKKADSIYDNVNYQHTPATDLMSFGANMSGEHNEKISSAEAQEYQSGKVSASSENQAFQPMELLRQTDHSINMNETSNGECASQISLQMASSWLKSHGTLNNPQPSPQLGTGNLKENDVTLEGIPAISSEVNGVWHASSSSRLLTPHNLSALDVGTQNLEVSMAKKRKVVAFESVAWHKEVKNDASRLQNTSMGELEWAQASNSRLEEAKHRTEVIDELPAIQAKRRLVFTTQLIQQVLRPAPAIILTADANLICDSVAYFVSRLVLGGACNLKSKPPSDTDDAPNGKQKTLGRANPFDISKLAEDLASRVKKLEGDLSRLDKSLSMTDVKAENQELEKFSVINRFAKFHMRPHPGTVDQASSSGLKSHVQGYITAHPMPKVIPEELDCLSL